jgi:uncharacterized protein
MGPKSFEQCAGFLKIPESEEPLDNTWVHPENYAVARDIRNLTVTAGLGSDAINTLKEKYEVGEITIRDIAEELKKPGRDMRDSFPPPVMRKDAINFEDLREGMQVTGKVKNVVDFGAFVDVGLKETALVHISELSDNFVKDPLETVKAGDVLEFRIKSLDTERRRIALTRRSADRAQVTQERSREAKTEAKPEVKHKPAPGKPQSKRPTHRSEDRTKQNRGSPPAHAARREAPAEDDGTMYNPFAEAFKKQKK